MGDKAIDVVAVHGIYQHRSNRDAMHKAWSAAIATGMRNRRTTREDGVTIECAFYGDLYNTGKGFASSPVRLADLGLPLEQELLLELAAGTDAGEDLPTKALGLVTLQSALRRLQKHKLFDGAADQIIRWVKQVNRYLSDSPFHDLVQTEMSRAMKKKPRVVVAHSLGSVVAYEWLMSHDSQTPTTLVTLGSPLGFRAIRLRLGAEDRALPWPRGLDNWVNVADENDLIATVKKLADVVDGDVDDHISRSPVLRNHSAVEYLTNPHTARSLVHALG